MWQATGHDWVVGVLDRSIAEERVSHAYLFAGPPSVGKSTLALNMAQALMCEQPDKPCGDCEHCRKTIEGIHPDVRIVDLHYQARIRDENPQEQNELRIDTIRSITQEASLKPFEGTRRVLLIPDAENMTSQASNALLKTLEEPPDHVVLLLTTADPRLLLPTIVSRCQVLGLRLVPIKLIEEELRLRHGVDAARAGLLARLSGGRIGWAISAARDSSMLQHREDTLREVAALPRSGRTDRLDYAARLTRSSGAIRETLELWLSWWRDLLLIKGGSPETIGNVDSADPLEQEAHRYDLRDIFTFLKAIRRTQRQLEVNVDPRLALEVLMLELPARSD
jgi:DNA polymerase-3 subunit delta'